MKKGYVHSLNNGDLLDKMEIFVVRHGQTDLNKEHIAQGRNGLPLNEKGIEQANKLYKVFRNEKIDFDFIYSSPQERAIETAKLCSGKDNIIIDNRLDVYDLGSADGLPLSEIKMTGTVPDMNAYSGVEELDHYKKRIVSFIDDIIKKYKNTNYKILIVGHKDSSGMIDAYFNKIDINTIYDDYLKLASSNCEYKKYIL